MGKRGPLKTPTKKLANRNSWRAKSRTGEPKSFVFQDGCPEMLGDVGRAKWFELVSKLQNSGIIKELDSDALARYCWWWESFVNLIGTNPAGLTDINRCEACLQKLGSKFGLSPSDRAGLSVEPKAKDDKYLKIV